MSKTKSEKEAIKWLARLNSPELSDNTKNAFFAWMESSPENQCAYIKAEQLWEQGGVYAQISEPAPLIQQWLMPRQILTIACSLACIIVCTALFYFGNSNIPEQEFHTATGEQQEFELNDGSKVLLNTNTTLRTKLLKGKRIAYLEKGEVLFTITKDKSRPFDVITPSGEVRVVGTQFSVYNQGEDALVTVIEGKVALGATTLIANQQLAIRAAGKGAAPKTVDASTVLSWRARELVYRGEPLGNVISDLNRYFDEEITLGNTALKTKEVVAVIHLGNVNAATSVLASSLNLKAIVDTKNNKIILH